AVVTGAAGRICSEVAKLLAADGTELVLLDRDADGLEAVAKPLRDSVKVECVAVDFADLDALDAVAKALAEHHAEIDLVFAGAGMDRGQSMLNFDWRKARDDFHVNTLANVVLMQRLLPGMVTRGDGHVTAIASLAALIGTPYEGVYSATKAALARLMDSARGELRGTGVTFTTAFPGFIDTPLMWANVYKHPYVVPLRDAAERIYAATLKRRTTVAFPARERARIALGGLLPTALRDRLAKEAMDPDVARGLGKDA
ncbi:MAG: SDR family NAD(P)-dependent oxidoreductase, partial [Thermoleophilia bacterium]|nr:SDR family NAD(P)-dependent oxidoreductase [Thermoleophilia bacterium]